MLPPYRQTGSSAPCRESSALENDFKLWQLSQHMKPHGIIRPRLSRQETINSIIYRPPDELVEKINRPWDWDTNPITVEIVPLDNKP